MTTFEEEIMEVAKRSIVKIFKDGLIMPDYSNRVKLPSDLVKRVYDSIDHNEVLGLIRQEINALVAKTIVNAMVTEITGDVKGVLSHGPTRARLREVVVFELDKLRKEGAA